MKSLFLRLLGASRPASSAPRHDDALQSAALQRLLPLAMGNAQHPYQASLLLYLMQQEQQRRSF